MIKFNKRNIIEVSDFDNLVQETYNRPYSFQQQDDCKSRGTFNFEVPSKYGIEDFENDTIPEIVNHSEMGVSFKAWLERDPNKLIPDDAKNRASSWKPTEEEIESMRKSSTYLWWDRNFYPHVDMIIEDLYKKGLIEEGEYTINIDW